VTEDVCQFVSTNTSSVLNVTWSELQVNQQIRFRVTDAIGQFVLDVLVIFPIPHICKDS
jgi:hypothetical protein